MADPSHLGKYAIEGVLGKGAMGIVYKGFDPHIERAVAIKTVRKDGIDEDLAAQFMARFRNEAKAAGRLHHPNIVGVYEYGENDDLAYIVMEYVQGTGLREHLNRRAHFDFDALVGLMSQLLLALDYAHSRGVVHRDIKPSNLIVAQNGVLKVADFGIARIDQSNLTSVGVVIGTPSYMSPEQCMGKDVDARSDLFSAGVVLYELLTGEKPFRGSVETIAYKICHEQPTPPSKLSALKLPDAVDRLCATALAKQPSERFQSAQAFHDALRQLSQMSVEVDQGFGETVMVGIGSMPLQAPSPGFDEATLDTAAHELARFLGPMARVLVRRAATQTRDRDELCAVLAQSIDDPDTRRKFVAAFAAIGASRGGAASATERSSAGAAAASLSRPAATTSSAPPLDAAYVDVVTGKLAVYLGPIARVLTKKAAARCSGRAEFARTVAANLGTQERAAFLRELGYPDA